MSVYAGIDPVLKKRHYLVETVPAGPSAARDTERVRTRLLNQVDERSNPRTKPPGWAVEALGMPPASDASAERIG